VESRRPAIAQGKGSSGTASQRQGRQDLSASVGLARRASIVVAAGVAILVSLAMAGSASAASFTATTERGDILTGLAVTFTTDGVPPGADVEWTYGDGTSGTDNQHTYMQPGSFHVEMNASGESAAGTVVVGQLSAPFVPVPSTPVAGQNVLFVYGGQVGSGPPASSFGWEMDGDSDFNEATGPSVQRVFPVAGDYVMGLKVTDAEGAFGSEFREIHVRAAPTVTPANLRLLSPFPVVRISGRVTHAGARIRRLTVQAPLGAKVTVRCGGRGCPFKKSSRMARANSKSKSKTASVTVRFRKMERRLLRGGATIRVYVTRQGLVGKYTRWTIRKAKPPLRRDLCLTPGASAPSACPSS
jgi:hypothetical protein